MQCDGYRCMPFFYLVDLDNLMLMQSIKERIICMSFDGIIRRFVGVFNEQEEEF